MALDAALGLPGSRPGAVTSLTRPTNPFQGQVIIETDTNTVLFYTTNGWVELGRAVTVGAEPTSPIEGELWYDTTQGALYVYASGVWEPASGETLTATIFDTKGDLIVATANDTAGILPVGSAGQVLVVNSATTTGLEWQTISTTPTWQSDQNILANRIFS